MQMSPVNAPALSNESRSQARYCHDEISSREYAPFSRKENCCFIIITVSIGDMSEIVCCRKSKYTDSVVSLEVKKSTSKWRDTGLIPADLGAMLTARTCYVDTAHFHITLH